MHQRGNHTRAGGSERVAQSDCPALGIDLLFVKAQLSYARQRLGGEGLVQLDEINVFNGQSGPFKHLAGRGNWSQAHACRINPRGCRDSDIRQRLQPKLFRFFRLHQQDRRRSVVDA